MPGATYYPSDAKQRGEWPLTELQGMTMEDKYIRLSCLAEPGLGAPLSSYLEGALYKLIDR